MPVKPPKEVVTEELDGEFTVVTATLRGTRYVIREMDAAEYQKCVDKAKVKDEETGFESSDSDILARLMLDKSIVEPDLTVAEIFKKPTTVVFKLNTIVNKVHYANIVSDEEEEEAEAEAEKKGEAKG